MKQSRIEREATIDSLSAGDLVRRNGRLRVVRDVARKAGGRVRSVTFSIQRCSWTRRPYTTVGRSDMYAGTLEVVCRGYGVSRGPLEVLLQRDIEAKGAASLLECCDVVGVIS